MDINAFNEKLEEIGISQSEFESALPVNLKKFLLPGTDFDNLKFIELISAIQVFIGMQNEGDDLDPDIDQKDLTLNFISQFDDFEASNLVTNWDINYSDTLDLVLQDILGINEEEFRTALGPPFEPGDDNVSMYDEEGELILSRITEIVASVNTFKEVNSDWTKEDILEFITACVETAETVKHLYIYNNDKFIPVFHRLAVEREALYNPIIPIAVVDHICPSCNHDKAYTWTKQVRSSDEPLQINYQCVKCRTRVKG